jgi:hypothetical protein
MLPTFYISDCSDGNVQARYAARITTVTPQAGPVQFIGVNSDLEAGGNLVDVLDGLAGAEALIFVNVAPRGTVKTKWPNGTPFGYLKWNHAHIFTTIDGLTLSLLKRISNTPLEVEVYDIPTVVPYLTHDTVLQTHIINSQFRSFDFLPRVAGYVLGGKTVPTTILQTIPDAPAAVWWIDNFGNAKTTILANEIAHKPGDLVNLSIDGAPHTIQLYNRLKDLPHGQIGIYTGSSGFGTQRFVEISKQKGEQLTHNPLPALIIASGQSVEVL